MKSPLILSLLALVLSAVALATTLMNSSTTQAADEAPRLPAAVAPATLAPDAELLARVEALAEADRELREKLALLEVRPVPEQRAPVTEGFASKEELAGLREEIRAALEGRKALAALAPGEPPSPEFTERVEQSMREVRVKEAVGRAQKNVESRSKRLSERMPDVAEQLGLTSQQRGALEEALVTLYGKQANYGVLWAKGEVEDRSEFGAIYTTDMEAFVADLGGFLTPQQLEDYLALKGGDLLPGGNDGDDRDG